MGLDKPYIRITQERDSLVAKVKYYGLPSREEMILNLVDGPVYEALQKIGFVTSRRDLKPDVICETKIATECKGNPVAITYTFYRKSN